MALVPDGFGMRLEYQYGPGKTRIIMALDKDATLDEVLEEFEGFLKAIGYPVNGRLDLVKEEE